MLRAQSGASPERKGERITPADLALFRRIAAEAGGLAIGEEKVDFLVARLGGQLLRLGLSDFSDYARHLARSTDPRERQTFVEALTTHTTSFFRERSQYDWLETEGFDLLAEMGAGRDRGLTIWSAACSSGQELYAAVMLAFPHVEAGKIRDVAGIGTDLSRPILRRAELGLYSGQEIDGIPLDLRRRYLLSARSGDERYRIAPELRSRCRWIPANLTVPADIAGVRADMIFVRNVLIYFAPDTRAQVLKAVIACLCPGGFLLTGHSETVEVKKFGLTTIKPSIYQKV